MADCISLHCTIKLPRSSAWKNVINDGLIINICNWDSTRGSGWSVHGEVTELKTKCPYWRRQICPGTQIHHSIWQTCSMLSSDANHSKLRGNHSNLSAPPPQCFVPHLWCTLIQNRTKQWMLEQIRRWGWARAQNNAPLTRGESLKICVPLHWGVFLEKKFFWSLLRFTRTLWVNKAF